MLTPIGKIEWRKRSSQSAWSSYFNINSSAWFCADASSRSFGMKLAELELSNFLGRREIAGLEVGMELRR
jgi:hypothetical protein